MFFKVFKSFFTVLCKLGLGLVLGLRLVLGLVLGLGLGLTLVLDLLTVALRFNKSHLGKNSPPSKH